jgi:hypothetical protein
MKTKIQLTLFTNKQIKIQTVTNYVSLVAARKLNSVGSCVLELPTTTDFNFLTLSQEDLGLLIEVEKNKKLVPLMDTFWFLRKINENGENKLFRLEFEDTFGLLRRRLNAYKRDKPRGSQPKSYLNGFTAEETIIMIKNNYSDLASPERQVSQITYGPVTGVTPQIKKEMSFKNLSSTLQQINRTAKDKGTPVYFDLLAKPSLNGINFEFNVFINQRGRNFTDETVRTDNQFFQLIDFNIDYNIATTAYVGGTGSGQDQVIGFADTTRANSGTFTRLETYKTVQSSDIDVLNDEARELVSEGGKVKLIGQLLGDLGDKFGLGDRLLVQHRNYLVECEIATERWEYRDKVLSKIVNVKSLE